MSDYRGSPTKRGNTGLSSEQEIRSSSDQQKPDPSGHPLVIACALFVLALVILLSLEHALGIPITGVSRAAYYNAQAISFLHGRWDVDLPGNAVDIEVLHGKSYSYYPPFPALLFLPFVAIFGASTSDILLTTLLSAANLSLLYLVLEQLRRDGWMKRVWSEPITLSLFCFFGSINLVLSLGGTIWFTAQIICMTCTLGSLLLGLRRHYGWSALLFSAACLSRFFVVLGLPVLLYLVWQDAGRQPALRQFLQGLLRRRIDQRTVPLRRLLSVLLVMIALFALFLVRNTFMFGSPLDTGYSTLIQQRYPEVTDGVFNLKYIPSNFLLLFLRFPPISFNGQFDRTPTVDLLGGGIGWSVFATTPFFLFLFWKNRSFNGLRAALWSTILPTVAILLCFYNEGWFQFGDRYLYDAYPYAFMLLALNEVRLDWRFYVLGFLSIVVNFIGAIQFWLLFPRL